MPRAYVHFTRNSFYHAPVMAATAARARGEGWTTRELAADHTAPETHPAEVAALIAELA